MENLNFSLNCDNEIRELLYRQQLLESIKSGRTDKALLSNAYAKYIFFHCSGNYRRKTSPAGLLKTIPAACFIAVNLLCTMAALFYLLILLLVPSDWLSTDPVQDSVVKRRLENPYANEAETAMRNGDYDTARSILTEKMAEHPNGILLFIDYSILCHLEGNQDEAAMTMVNFLNNNYGTQNVPSRRGMLYQWMTELPGPFSPDVETAYQECMAACDKSIANFASLESFLENGEYQSALQLCDSMQHQNTNAELIYNYYYTCYMKLEKYEDCAAYFLGLANEWQTEEFPSTRLPFKSAIVQNLTELKPYVSTETQQKIDDACVMLEQE